MSVEIKVVTISQHYLDELEQKVRELEKENEELKVIIRKAFNVSEEDEIIRYEDGILYSMFRGHLENENRFEKENQELEQKVRELEEGKVKAYERGWHDGLTSANTVGLDECLRNSANLEMNKEIYLKGEGE